MGAGDVFFISSYVLTIIGVLFVLFKEKTDSARRFSWLLAIVFIPVAGIFLYILLSGNFFTRTKRMMRAARRANAHYESILHSQEARLKELIATDERGDFAQYGALLHLNLVYGKSPILRDNSIDLFIDGKDKFAALFEEIQQAQSSIHVSYFIFQNDHIGNRLVELLAERARAGVAVRLLYDHVGSIRTSASMFRSLRKAGGRVSRFFPVSLVNPFQVNYRNHRKLVVIDGRVAWFGGMNVGDEYANQSPKFPFYWRDTHVRITGPAVQLLQKVFLVDWFSASERDEPLFDEELLPTLFPLADDASAPSALRLPRERHRDGIPAQIVASGPDDMENDEIRDALILMIGRARQSVRIETPYFTPDEAFFTALKIAALSGIRVEIIVPGNWDKWYVKPAAMPFIEDLLACGVHFWYYRGFIHSKMFIIDDKVASIGTTNVDKRSFSLHFELNAFFYSPDSGALCTAIFEEDKARSDPVDEADFKEAGLVKRAYWNLMSLFSPIM